MSDHELIDQLLDVVPTEATPGNRLKRLDAKYRAPEKLSKLQPRHLLLIEYMTHGISSPVRCRQLRIGVDQPLSLIEAADAARVRRREARRISVDPLFVGELKRQLRAFRESLHPEAIRTMAAIMQEVGENSAADRTVRLKASTTLGRKRQRRQFQQCADQHRRQRPKIGCWHLHSHALDREAHADRGRARRRRDDRDCYRHRARKPQQSPCPRR